MTQEILFFAPVRLVHLMENASDKSCKAQFRLSTCNFFNSVGLT